MDVGSPDIPPPYNVFDSIVASLSSSPGLTNAGHPLHSPRNNSQPQLAIAPDVLSPTRILQSQNTPCQRRGQTPPAQAALTSSPRPSGLKATQVAWCAVPNVPALPPPAPPPPPLPKEEDETAAFPAAGCSFAGQNDRAGGCLARLPPPLDVSTYPVDSTLPREKGD